MRLLLLLLPIGCLLLELVRRRWPVWLLLRWGTRPVHVDDSLRMLLWVLALLLLVMNYLRLAVTNHLWLLLRLALLDDILLLLHLVTLLLLLRGVSLCLNNDWLWGSGRGHVLLLLLLVVRLMLHHHVLLG